MGDTERPIPERLGDQHEQAAHLVRTGNGPTVEDEQRLLTEQYGAPDMAGHYVGPALAADQDDEPAAEGEPAPAEGTAKGGESA
jgi:hypothetical protein